MPLLAVDPQQYAAASTVFGAELADCVTGTYSTLTRGLGHTGAMAGHDSAGRSWGESYDSAVTIVAQAITAFQRACLVLGSLLQHTGFNYSVAEARSDMASRWAVPDTSDYQHAPALNWQCGDIPGAAGGSGDYPAGWSVVRTLVRFEWPDGRPELLRAAGSAWKQAASGLQDLTHFVDDAVANIAQRQAPEALDATTVCRAMKTHLHTLASVCTELAGACSIYAGVIDKIHAQCGQLLSDLVNDIDTAAISGMIFAGETEGDSEDLALEYSSHEAIEVAQQVTERLARFASDVGEIVDFEMTVASESGDVTAALQPILLGTPSTASTIMLAGGPFAAAHNAEIIATERLTVAAQINWAGLEDAERRGGHTIARHVGKSDAFLIKRAENSTKPANKVRVSTFLDYAIAEQSTAQNIAANLGVIDLWLKSKSNQHLTISCPVPSSVGRIYLKLTGKIVTPTRAITVLKRDRSGHPFVVTSFPEA